MARAVKRAPVVLALVQALAHGVVRQGCQGAGGGPGAVGFEGGGECRAGGAEWV